MTDPLDGCDQDAYNAAFQALSGRYNGDIHATAEHITRWLVAQQERHGMRYMLRLTQAPNVRAAIVNHITNHAAHILDVRGGADHVRPLVDAAVKAGAQALWDGPNVTTVPAAECG